MRVDTAQVTRHGDAPVASTSPVRGGPDHHDGEWVWTAVAYGADGAIVASVTAERKQHVVAALEALRAEAAS